MALSPFLHPFAPPAKDDMLRAADPKTDPMTHLLNRHKEILLLLRGFCHRKGFHFNLIKLMLAQNPLYITPITARLSAKRRRIGHIAQR